MIAGIILAAGASSRMGTPKALLEYRGERFIERLARVLSIGCEPVIIVLGYHAEQIRPHLPARVTVATNPDPDRGQLSSLQAGLLQIPDWVEGFAFTTVDCPAVEASTVKELAVRFSARKESTLLVVPQYHGKHGHPVFATREIATELLALPAKGQAREVVHRHVDRTEYIDVEDPGILTDIDDREAYLRLMETTR